MFGDSITSLGGVIGKTSLYNICDALYDNLEAEDRAIEHECICGYGQHGGYYYGTPILFKPEDDASIEYITHGKKVVEKIHPGKTSVVYGARNIPDGLMPKNMQHLAPGTMFILSKVVESLGREVTA